MRKPVFDIVASLCIGLIAGFALGTKHTTIFAQQGPPPSVPPQSQQGADGLQNHLTQQRLTLQPDQALPLTLPVMDTPVRIDVSMSPVTVDCGNATTETVGPAAFGGVWSKDSLSGKISPLGDNKTGNAFVEVHCLSEPQGAVEFSLFTDEQLNELIIKNQSVDQVQNIAPVDVSINMWY